MTWGGFLVNRSVHVVGITTGTAVVVVRGSPYVGGQPGASMRTNPNRISTRVAALQKNPSVGTIGERAMGRCVNHNVHFRPPRTVAQMLDLNCSYMHTTN